MNPLPDFFPVRDLNWWLRKKHKTHFASGKNSPGTTSEWYKATQKMREEHLKALADPNYKVDPTVAEEVGKLLKQAMDASTPSEGGMATGAPSDTALTT